MKKGIIIAIIVVIVIILAIVVVSILLGHNTPPNQPNTPGNLGNDVAVEKMTINDSDINSANNAANSIPTDDLSDTALDNLDK